MTVAGTMPTGASARMRQLDSLRALSAIGVVLVHTLPWSAPFLRDLERNALALFFVLSGFLITGVLLRSRDRVEAARVARRTALLDFYWRRCLRIFPAYYLAIAVMVALGIGDIRETLLWHLGYGVNYLMAFSNKIPAARHLWSLAVEEQFYLFWPLLILYAPRRRLPWLVAAAVAVGPISRFTLYLLTGRNLPAIMPVSSWLDTLGIGAALALLRADPVARHRCDRLAPVALALGGILMALQCLLQAHGASRALVLMIGPLPLALLAVGIIHPVASGVRGPIGRTLEHPMLLYLGTISYGIYVYHPLVPMTVQSVISSLGLDWSLPHSRGWRKTLFVLVAAIAAASVSWLLYERPLQRWRDRFGSRRRRREVALPSSAVPSQAL